MIKEIIKKLLEGEDIREVLIKEAGKKVNKWSAKVKTKWTPPAGTFTKSAQEIAKVLFDASKDLKQAMSRLNFYINRAGRNLSPARRAELEKAKDLLRKMFAQKQAKAAGMLPSDYPLDQLTEEELKELEDEFKDYVD